MKRDVINPPPWPAFVDAIFAVLLIILLILMLFLVFRVLFVIETESTFNKKKNLVGNKIQTFAVKKYIEKEVKEKESIEFNITKDKFIAKLGHGQSLSNTQMIKELDNFYQKHPDKNFKILISIYISDDYNLRKDIYNQALSLIGNVNDNGEINISLEIKYGTNKLLIFESTAVNDNQK